MTGTTAPSNPPEDRDRDSIHVENGIVWMWHAEGQTWTRLKALPLETGETSGVGGVRPAGQGLADVAAGAHQAGITRPVEAYRRGR